MNREYVCLAVPYLEAYAGETSTEYIPREEVVRCRDCRRSFKERGELWCRGIVGPPVEPNGFCAWGERGKR